MKCVFLDDTLQAARGKPSIACPCCLVRGEQSYKMHLIFTLENPHVLRAYAIDSYGLDMTFLVGVAPRDRMTFEVVHGFHIPREMIEQAMPSNGLTFPGSVPTTDPKWPDIPIHYRFARFRGTMVLSEVEFEMSFDLFERWQSYISETIDQLLRGWDGLPRDLFGKNKKGLTPGSGSEDETEEPKDGADS